MITIETRRLEQPRTARQGACKAGCMERFITVGTYVIVAIVIGGVVSLILQVTFFDRLSANLVGISAGGLLAILIDRFLRALNPLPDWEGVGESLDRVLIENIVRAVPVYELEDFGPGYIVETKEQERIYIAGQIVGEIDDDGESLRDTIWFEANSVSHEILDIAANGARISIDAAGVDVNDLPLTDVYTGYQILSD